MRKWVAEGFDAIITASLVVGTCTLLGVVLWGVQNREATVVALSSLGLVVMVVGDLAHLLVTDELRSQATRQTLKTASATLDHLQGGLTHENCQAICETLLPETRAMAVGMSNREVVMGYAGEGAEDFPPGSPIHTPATRRVIETGKMEAFTSIRMEDEEYLKMLSEEQRERRIAVVPAGIVVPLKVRDEVVGALKFYYRRRRDIDRSQQTIARGFGRLLSTQLSAIELDRQAELTARAEVKALQAQINPHFLFNTLNTIASLTRTDPAHARDLLREFATFYRQTLENSEQLITIDRELEQTRRYLKFEHARFGEDRIIEREQVTSGCGSVRVPAFLIQPIVENAVRHGMRDEGPLHIDVHVTAEGGDVLISVTDDGLGMDEQVAARLVEGVPGAAQAGSKGTGVALRNVAERVERFYGIGSGIEIMSRPGEGTNVTIRLANAAPGQEDDQP